jgi:endonuclease/exonuclease/phosphatase family metal-dependent hydrolase
MKVNFKKIFLSICFLIGILTAEAQTLKIATFNIRYYNEKDSGNLWVDRAPRISALIGFHDFDIFGVQEAYKNQLDDMNNALPAYARYGVGRDDGKEAGEHFILVYFGNMGGEEGAMPPILPTTDKKRLNTHYAIAVRQREYVCIAYTLSVNRLRPLNEGQRL